MAKAKNVWRSVGQGSSPTIYPSGTTAPVRKNTSKLGIYSSQKKGKEIFGGKTKISRDWNKGPIKRGK